MSERNRFIERRVYYAGEVIFHEGTQGEKAYLIMKGQVSVSVATPSGGEVLLAKLGQGEIFGEMAMIDPAPRTATVTAETETVVAYLSRPVFDEKLAQSDPLIRALLRLLVRNVRQLTLRVGK
jgi:CRP-like cAMP-binding protein